MSDVVNKEVEAFDEDIFESMLNGSFAETVAGEDDVEDDVADTEDFNEDDGEHHEDTDQEEDSEADDETNQDGDGDLEDTLEGDEDDEEEDSPVEDYDSDDEGSDTAEESEDDTDTEDSSDGKSSDTDVVDYKAFYDAVVNAEFTVNGRKTKGFADPKKIIQAQQMAGGFSEKMAGFKQYRPFMAPLKERGMLEDQEKFNLAMNIIDGDTEAIKAHLKSLKIDPLDLDMDIVSYSGKSAIAAPETLIIEDTLERAKMIGVEDKVRQVVGKEWDTESFKEFTANEAVRNDLLNHLETGVYDLVQDKMLELSRLDYSGQYGDMSTINRYRAAVAELQREYQGTPSQTAPTQAPVKSQAPKSSVASEKAKIEQARKEREYKAKAEAEKSKLSQQRRKAASLSKKSTNPKPKAQFNPMDVEGQELDELINFLASGGRG